MLSADTVTALRSPANAVLFALGSATALVAVWHAPPEYFWPIAPLAAAVLATSSFVLVYHVAVSIVRWVFRMRSARASKQAGLALQREMAEDASAIGLQLDDGIPEAGWHAAIIRALRRADARYLTAREISAQTGASVQDVKADLEWLDAAGFVDDRISSARGRSFTLSSRGIAWCRERGG